MKIDAHEIPETIDLVFTVPKSDFEFPPEELDLKDEIKVTAHLQKLGRKIFLRANLSTSLDLECSRCLEHFNYTLNETFQVVFEPLASKPLEEELELNKDDLDVEMYEDDLIDLTEIVKEQIFLAVPMIPICSEECKGLCPECGENLNHRACSCNKDRIDPRWKKLQSLVNKKIITN